MTYANYSTSSNLGVSNTYEATSVASTAFKTQKPNKPLADHARTLISVLNPYRPNTLSVIENYFSRCSKPCAKALKQPTAKLVSGE